MNIPSRSEVSVVTFHKDFYNASLSYMYDGNDDEFFYAPHVFYDTKQKSAQTEG